MEHIITIFILIGLFQLVFFNLLTEAKPLSKISRPSRPSRLSDEDKEIIRKVVREHLFPKLMDVYSISMRSRVG